MAPPCHAETDTEPIRTITISAHRRGSTSPVLLVEEIDDVPDYVRSATAATFDVKRALDMRKVRHDQIVAEIDVRRDELVEVRLVEDLVRADDRDLKLAAIGWLSLVEDVAEYQFPFRAGYDRLELVDELGEVAR